MEKILSCFTSAPSICQNVMFLAKKNSFKFRTKIVLFGYFWLELKKATVLWVFYISTIKFFQTKFRPKIKILKFGTKLALIGSFGLEFLKKVEFQIIILDLEFVNMQSFIQKRKKIKLGSKNTLLRYFSTTI